MTVAADKRSVASCNVDGGFPFLERSQIARSRDLVESGPTRCPGFALNTLRHV